MITACGLRCQGNVHSTLLGKHGCIHIRHRIVNENLENSLESGQFEHAHVMVDDLAEDFDIHSLDRSGRQSAGNRADPLGQR